MTSIKHLEPPSPPVPRLIVKQKKPLKTHPWQETIKDYNINRILRAHNSVGNPLYPKPKEGRKPFPQRTVFTVIGNRVTKEFMYCVKMVQGMHKYRWQSFGAPIIKGVTGVEWPLIFNELKIKYDQSEAYCLPGQVAVLYNNKFLGGEKELKDVIEQRYIYHLALNYPKESINLFRNFVRSSGRACAYLHISIDDKPIGCLMFMLYSDIAPNTCENFLRLCQTTKGGYSGTPVHRIVEGSWIQCGGFGLKDTPLGCENFIVPHDKRGVLGMCNADRGVDCSTQFYVLLQPASWMNYNYVAFGQLIDGEETLKKIEAVPTFYESPTKIITIFKTGLLNMECDDIMINRGAVAFIDSHIDDLVSIGEMLYEWLMELVSLEIEFRYLEGLEVEAEGEDERKEEKSSVRKPSDIQNSEFDVEDYPLCEFESEAYVYDQVSFPSSTIVKKKLPYYYIPLTDVPYPGDNDSNYDLKRFLQGNYCLEADLDPNVSKNVFKDATERAKEIMAAYVESSMHCVLGPHYEGSSESDDILDDERDTQPPGQNLEAFNFAGPVVKHIAVKFAKDNPLEDTRTTFNDEEIRRIRMALQDLRVRNESSVTTKVSPWEMHKQITRRGTTYYPDQKSIDSINFDEDEDSEDSEDPQETYEKKKVSILDPVKTSIHKKIRRRPTGMWSIKYTDSDIIEEIKGIGEEEEQSKEAKHKVSFERDVERWSVSPKVPRRFVLDSDQDVREPSTRPSVLARLYSDVAMDSDEDEPTLKDHHKLKDRKSSKDFMFLAKSKTKDLLAETGEFKDDGPPPPLSVAGASNFTIKRRTITIAAYKLKNQQYAEKMKQGQAMKEKERVKL